jgi:cysteine desulfurase/selenocysteine lyase
MIEFNVEKIRQEFPILRTLSRGKKLVYLDNAATTQKPISVLNAEKDFYCSTNANIHRGVYELSQKATDAYEHARVKIQKFLGAKQSSEIIFTKGTTDSINLFAHSFSKRYINEGDEIIISQMEHHSNIVPWQFVAEYRGAKLKILPINDNGELMIDLLPSLINAKTKLISLTYVSNSLGTINPVEEVITLAHSHGIPVFIDAAQAVQHLPINVQELDCDFLALSGHKIYGPYGTGVLYGKQEYLKEMPPYQGGGDMILSVSFEKSIFQEPPLKFEAGTPNISGIVALGSAIDFIDSIGLENIKRHEGELTNYTLEQFSSFDKIKLYGNSKGRVGVFSFLLEGIHPHDIGTILDMEGIAIRTGHHCTQPVMQKFGIPATARLSLGLYNTKDEIDYFMKSLHHVYQVFS